MTDPKVSEHRKKQRHRDTKWKTYVDFRALVMATYSPRFRNIKRVHSEPEAARQIAENGADAEPGSELQDEE